MVIRRKTAFLLSTLLLPVPTDSSSASHPLITSLLAHGFPSTLISSLGPSFPAPGSNSDEPPASEDADYREKSARVIIGLLERGALKKDETKTFEHAWEAAKQQDGGVAEYFGLAREETAAVEKLL